MNFEINMINVEDGDAIILQLKKADKKALIVIDGGYQKHYSKLKKRLDELLPDFNNKIELIICSHYDNDHLEGISFLLDDCQSQSIEIGEIWMHKIEDRLEDLILGMDERIQYEKENWQPEKKKLWKIMYGSFNIPYDDRQDQLVLENYAYLKGLIQKIIDYGLENKIREVKRGDCLEGFEEFKVVSPKPEFYNYFLPQLKQEKFLEDVKRSSKRKLLESSEESKTIDEHIMDTISPCERLKTSSIKNRVTPTNMVSIVTLLTTHSKKLLFTADSGIESYQQQELLNAELNNLDWLQLPHHGSKNNTSKIMLDHFNPEQVFVSGKNIENRPDSVIVGCLSGKNRLKAITVTNSDLNTWYLKFDQSGDIERVLI